VHKYHILGLYVGSIIENTCRLHLRKQSTTEYGIQQSLSTAKLSYFRLVLTM